MLGIQGCHQRNDVITLAAGRCGFDRFVDGGGYRRSFVRRRVSTAVLSFTSVTLVSKCLLVALRCSKASGKALWRCVHIAAAASLTRRAIFYYGSTPLNEQKANCEN